MTKLYYEAHVTIDPVEDDDRITHLKGLAQPCGFRLAKLLLRKGRTPSTDDAFLTCRTTDREEIEGRTRLMVAYLKDHGYGVRRYKIEDTLVDSKMDDEWGLLQ
jgi:hypothetical protein